MKTLLVNTSDIQGGAARAAYRLHMGLRQVGVESGMLVKDKTSDDYLVIGPSTKVRKGLNKVRPFLDKLPLRKYPEREQVPWSVSWFPNNFGRLIHPLDPDIIHLHWIGDGFISLASLRSINKPILWTLHDMWAFTGGCHYSGGCTRYEQQCGSCPQLGSRKEQDLSRWVWKRKKKFWKDLNITVVTPSRWLAECARSSSLFRDIRVEVIPNGIDLKLFKPIDQQVAREILGVPLGKKLILFGAMNAASDPRKGFHYLQPALQILAKEGWGDSAELMIFGSTKPLNPPELGLKAHYLGRLYDDITLTLLYSAADVFVAPSIEENLVNTIVESLSCGTPCVAFDIGGMPDMIDHQENGYLARPFETSDLAQGISWVISNSERWSQLSGRSRQKAEDNFELQKVAKRYVELYQEVLDKS